MKNTYPLYSLTPVIHAQYVPARYVKYKTWKT
jgi:hypothetical protein